MIRLPGMVDAHVHLRDPGAPHKESVSSGTAAALAGGVIAVLDMPNTRPPTTDSETLRAKQALFADQALCDYGLFLGFDGTHLQPLARLASNVIGLKLYLDETFGHLLTSEPKTLAQVFERWPGPGPIAVHASSESITVALGLARRYHQHLHVCHVPHPDDLLAIDRARQAGVNVTCEVTPHHLFLSTDDAARLGTFGQMKPPLVTPDLVQRFWDRLDLVDIVASDHAPHTREEKTSQNPPPGVPGLETTLPLLLWAVHKDRITADRMRDLVYEGPLRVYGLAAPADTWVDVDITGPYKLPGDGYITRCGWSPFAGLDAIGRVVRVHLRGQTVWENQRVLASPGYGQPLQQRCEATDTGGE